jgi:hypothetical protein
VAWRLTWWPRQFVLIAHLSPIGVSARPLSDSDQAWQLALSMECFVDLQVCCPGRVDDSPKLKFMRAVYA